MKFEKRFLEMSLEERLKLLREVREWITLPQLRRVPDIRTPKKRRRTPLEKREQQLKNILDKEDK